MPRYKSERDDAYYIFGKGNHNITMILIPAVIIIGGILFLRYRQQSKRGYY